MIDDWLAQLSTVGWCVDRNWNPAAVQMKLPAGEAVWLDGKVGSVDRSAWLLLESGTVMLHGASEKDDCTVSEFCRRLTEPPPVVASQPAQGRLF